MIKALMKKLKNLINMKERVDYVLVEKPSSEFYSIKLLTGNWTGVIYTYGTVSIKEDKANDTAVLQFQFKIDECPEEIDSDSLMTNESFKNYIGDILSSILEQNEYKIGKN
jgi:hypothetical protein